MAEAGAADRGHGGWVEDVESGDAEVIQGLGIRVDVLDTRNAAAQFNLLATERGVSEVAGLVVPAGFCTEMMRILPTRFCPKSISVLPDLDLNNFCGDIVCLTRTGGASGEISFAVVGLVITSTGSPASAASHDEEFESDISKTSPL